MDRHTPVGDKLINLVSDLIARINARSKTVTMPDVGYWEFRSFRVWVGGIFWHFVGDLGFGVFGCWGQGAVVFVCCLLSVSGSISLKCATELEVSYSNMEVGALHSR